MPYTPYVLPEVSIPEGVPTFNLEDYTVLEEIGGGGTGVVSKVKNKFTNEFYAIKDIAIFSDELGDERHQQQIQHDMILATSLDHPNVMRCLGVCKTKTAIYFLCNYMPINFYRRPVEDEHMLAQMAYQLLQGLSYLRKEKGLVFKHLTPGNILFDPISNLVKISDVGIVKDKYITLRYVNPETTFMKYIAPENLHDGNHLVDLQSDRYQKSDAWRLGLCLLQLYNNGKYPLDAPHHALYRFLMSGFFRKPPIVVDDDRWPPKPPSDASPLFRDFISSCLNLDVSQRAGVDDLLTHHFLVSNGYVHNVDHPLKHKMKEARLSNEAIVPIIW